MAKVQVRDQYADGEAARAWARFIGDAGRRTRHYGAFLRRILQGEHEHAHEGVKKVLDVACGTGVDSVLLLETGAFHLTSTDASDQMLKHALRTRWARRREPQFDAWQIEEANWLTLLRDLSDAAGLRARAAFDAVLCLGNSFAHMPALPAPHKDPQAQQRTALANFWACVRPGGVLVVDHRNYDHILRSGATPASCFYYNNSVTDIRTSVVYEEGRPVEVAMDYAVGHADKAASYNDTGSSGHSSGGSETDSADEREEGEEEEQQQQEKQGDQATRFRLTYYPHRLRDFCRLLREALGEEQAAAARHEVYADFHSTPISLENESSSDKESPPAVYVHVLYKPL